MSAGVVAKRAPVTRLGKLPLEAFEEAALPERLALVDDSHTIRGLAFRGLAVAIETHCGKAKRIDVMRKLGVGPEFDCQARHSLRRFFEVELAAARVIAAELGDFDLAVAECGAGVISAFFASRPGWALRSLAGHDPHRMLGAVPAAYQLMVNFGERSWTKTSESSGVFEFRNELLGCTHVFGNFEAALARTYGIDVHYDLIQTSLFEFEFRMCW